MVTKCFENKDFIMKIQEGLVFFFIVLGVAGGVPNVFPSSSQDVPIRFPKCFHTFHERISKEPTVQSEFI
jgi:hypothetical protein